VNAEASGVAHDSIQGDHAHLIVEAQGKEALARSRRIRRCRALSSFPPKPASK
jgi:hypothetical protein